MNSNQPGPIDYKQYMLLSGALLACALIYLLGLSGDFYFDDEHNILRNQSLQMESLSWDAWKSAWHSGTAGPLKRPIAMLTFGINYYAHGFEPFYFKLTNLFIHLFNGLGLFILTKALITCCFSKSSKPHTFVHWLPLVLAALWLLHPLNLTTVLYVVQRMAGLSAFFCIWGMASYTIGRQLVNNRNALGYLLLLASLFIFLPLAAFSKENGLLLPFYLFLIEWLIFQFKTPDKRHQLCLYILFSLICAIPAIIGMMYLFAKPEWIAQGYVNRDFSFVERVLTQSRVLVFYLRMIILPSNTELGLFHDDFTVSKSLLQPASTLYSMLFLISTLLTALLLRKKTPIISFGILFFFTAHTMESSALALELVHEHRNYLADFGILLASSYFLLVNLPNYLSTKLSYFVILACIILLGIITLSRSQTWGQPFQHALAEVQHHPNSPRANYQLGKIYASVAHNALTPEDKQKKIELATFYFKKSAQVNPSYTDGLFGLITLHGIERIPLDAEAFNMLLYRLENRVFLANNYNAINGLLYCLKKEVCKIEPEVIDNIIISAKKNKLFSGKHKNNTLMHYELYQKHLASKK